MYNSGPYNTQEYNPGGTVIPAYLQSPFAKTGEEIEVLRPYGYVQPQQS